MWSVRPPSISPDTWSTVFRTTGRLIAASARRVTSRALEYSPGASRPSGRTKCESGRPSRRALAFIRSANCSKLGTVASASASAASFADWIRAPLTRSPTVSSSPAASAIDSCPTAAARGSTVTTSRSRRWSSATSTVISFVIDAIGIRSRAAWEASTSPVTGFSTSQARASGAGDGAAAAAAAHPTARQPSASRQAVTARSLIAASSRCPMKSAVGVAFGLSRSSVAAGMPVRAAIDVIVSPARTT